MPSRIQYFRLKAFERQGRRCCYCSVRMWLKSPSELDVPIPSLKAADALRCTAEHLQPRSEGGRDVSDNVAAACSHCNQTRHKRKRPLAASDFGTAVRKRIAARAWHPEWVHRGGLL